MRIRSGWLLVIAVGFIAAELYARRTLGGTATANAPRAGPGCAATRDLTKEREVSVRNAITTFARREDAERYECRYAVLPAARSTESDLLAHVGTQPACGACAAKPPEIVDIQCELTQAAVRQVRALPDGTFQVECTFDRPLPCRYRVRLACAPAPADASSTVAR